MYLDGSGEPGLVPSSWQSQCGWPGQAAAAHSGAISLSRPAPSPPHHTADVQQGLPGAGRHIALNDTFALILHTVMSLLPPAIPTQYIKNMAKACHWINSLNLLQLSNTWQNQLPAILVYTREECHLEVILHSPFTPNGKSKRQATSKFPCGSHWCSNSTLIYNHQSLGERESGEGSQFSFLFTWCGFKGPWNSVLLQQDLEVRVWLVSSLPWSRCLFSSSVSEAFLHLP